eukprot:4813714-Prymnesium_polylepis.1
MAWPRLRSATGRLSVYGGSASITVPLVCDGCLHARHTRVLLAMLWQRQLGAVAQTVPSSRCFQCDPSSN